MVVEIELRCSRLHDTLPLELSPNSVTVSVCDLHSLVLLRPLDYQNSTLIGNPIPNGLPWKNTYKWHHTDQAGYIYVEVYVYIHIRSEYIHIYACDNHQWKSYWIVGEQGELCGRAWREERENDGIILQSQKINNVSFKMSFKCLWFVYLKILELISSSNMLLFSARH